MINPSEINLSTLPSLPIESRSQFPRIPAIYFCLTPEGFVVYIGETSNLLNRWRQCAHEKEKGCKELGCDRIAWLSPVPEVRYHRLPTERELIRLHRPVLNMQLWSGMRVHNPEKFHESVLPELQAIKDKVKCDGKK